MYKQNLSLTLDPSLSFYIGCTVCFFSFLNTLQPEWMLGRHLCWGRRGSHMTQSRSSGPKQERGSMSRHGTSRDCLQPHHDDKSICTVQHRSDRMQDPSGGGPGISCVCVCVAGLRAHQFEKFCCERGSAIMWRQSLGRVRGGLAEGVRVQAVQAFWQQAGWL